MGTKQEGDRCYDAALADEPMFVLLARDPSAPTLVLTWAEQRTHDISIGRRPVSDMGQVREAQYLAARMIAWRIAADESWRKQDAFDFGRGVEAHEAFPERVDALADQHSATRQTDEYYCSKCFKRWSVNEDAPESCA